MQWNGVLYEYVLLTNSRTEKCWFLHTYARWQGSLACHLSSEWSTSVVYIFKVKVLNGIHGQVHNAFEPSGGSGLWGRPRWIHHRSLWKRPWSVHNTYTALNMLSRYDIYFIIRYNAHSSKTYPVIISNKTTLVVFSLICCPDERSIMWMRWAMCILFGIYLLSCGT